MSRVNADDANAAAGVNCQGRGTVEYLVKEFMNLALNIMLESAKNIK